MELFLGTKLINAKPMNRQEYNDFRGWILPADEDGSDEGYLVEYLDGGTANTPAYSGYVSWSPKEVFEKAYKASGSLSFGHALELLKQGKKVTRKAWDGANQFVYYVKAAEYRPCTTAMLMEFKGHTVPYRAYLAIKTTQGDIATWAPSCSDALAEDWCIVVD